MAVGSKTGSGKQYMRIITWIITGVIGLMIVVTLFFKLVPGYNFFVVRSGSMAPAINVGDLIFTGPIGDISTGKVITFNKDGETITHRIYSIENGRISTKGDANRTADPGTISATDIKGTYLFKIPGLGYITDFTATKKGWFFVIIVPAAILILFLVKDILKEAFKEDKKKVAEDQIRNKPQILNSNDQNKSTAQNAAIATPRAESNLKASFYVNPVPKKSTSKKSFFSFLTFDDESPAPVAAAASSGNINAEINTSSSSGEKARKRPFYSFLLFDDEDQKAPSTASTEVFTNTTLASPETSRSAVIGYPSPEMVETVLSNEVRKENVSQSLPYRGKSRNGSFAVGEAVRGPVAAPVLSWLEFVRQPVVPVNNAEDEMERITNNQMNQSQSLKADSPAFSKKSQTNKESIFSNKEVTDNVKNELKRLLDNFN